MYQYSFEKLEVWQLARSLTKELYSLTNSYPAEEKFGLTSQIRRATISISNNLAEGSARKTSRDQVVFTTYAFSSLMEVLNMIILSLDLELISEVEYNRIRPMIDELANKVNALRIVQGNR